MVGLHAVPTLQARGPHLPSEQYLLSATPLLIGRDANDCGVCFPPETVAVSRVHASVTWDASSAVAILRDEGSKNGTFVDGVGMLEAGEAYHLKPGIAFWVGRPEFRFILTT